MFDATAVAAAFPLGGIGTGNVSIGARGELRDWEIFNRPAKNSRLPNTFFALHAQAEGQPAITRVLEGPIPPPHTWSHGYHPATGAGLPRLASATMRGEYPFVTIAFEDPKLPVRAQLEAFTPLIPLDPDDSGLPCGIFTFTLTNTTQTPVALTLVASLTNPIGGIGYDPFGNLIEAGEGRARNAYREEGDRRGLDFSVENIPADDLRYGSLSLVTDHKDVTYKRAWMRGAWWDFLQEFWDDLTADGRLTDLGYEEAAPAGRPDTGSLGLCDTLAPGESRSYRLLLTWNFPNRPYAWNPAVATRNTRNHYATRFENAWAVAQYVQQNFGRLEQETRTFHDALFGSTLPAYVLDALSANIVPIRSTTCFRLEDGRFFGWEGCFDTAGCCEGSCTHVWSYAQTLAFLFPSLERDMRRTEFLHETADDGFMHFRNVIHLEAVEAQQRNRFEAAADGQMGSVLRTYREFQLSGDKEWLRALWPEVKKAVGYAGSHWDTDGDGLLDGKQHNTYDIEFYGPNPLCALYYLAALRAAAEMADALGEPEVAQRCRDTFAKGSARADEVMWNGEYYEQKLEDVNAHKYQHGLGCLSDQLLGQLHARVLGLGDLLPAEHIKQAVKAIFTHNFRRDFRDHVNCQRTYVLNDEAGLLLCTWPRGGRPHFPFPYSDEVWTGFEYQVAAHLIYEGWLSEGLEIVKAVQARHDGTRRNPWNEVECGNHYARSMSSWAVLLALSGAHSDLSQHTMRFAPVLEASTEADTFRTFWSNGRGWGTYTQRRDAKTGAWVPEVQVLGGDLTGVRVSACGREWTL
jgi:uncharacterized protein (DUF608 family)